VPGVTQRVTADQAPGGKPDASGRSVKFYGLRRVVRARRQEAAGASKERRNEDLVAPQQDEA